MTQSKRSSSLSAGSLLFLGAAGGYLFATLGVSSQDHHRRLEEEATASEHHEGVNADKMDTAVASIVMILIFLTIFFERIKEHIEESADRNLKPIISSLFGELTVLGFLSICTFCVTKLGFFTQLSVRIFGEHEEEELLEIFEFVHYMLFFVMVFFVITVLVLVHGAKEMEKKWFSMNKGCRDKKYLQRLDQLQAASSGSNKSGWFRYLCRHLMPCFGSKTQRYRAELELFRNLREEFILERSAEPPFAAHSNNGIEDDFNFGRYLGIVMGHVLGHAVHLNMATWMFLALLTAVFYGVILGIANQDELFAWIWVGTGFFFVLLGNFFDYHILEILKSMSRCTSPAGADSENGSLLSSGRMPEWTRIDLNDYMARKRSCWIHCFGKKNAKVTHQDTMYWLERKGPKMYMIILQIQLIFTAAYVSLLMLTFYPLMFGSTESDHQWFAYIILSAIPVVLLLTKYQTAAANLTMACSIGVHRKPHAVAQVRREEKTDRIIRAMVTMQKIQHGAEHGFQTPHGQSHQLDAAEMEEVGKTFDALDRSGDGNIETKELESVLEALGVRLSTNSIQAVVDALDSNKDGSVSRSEFIAFYTSQVSLLHGEGRRKEHKAMHHLAQELFQQFDSDNSGEITLGEFKDVLDAFNVGFSVDEIGDLVNELDEEDDGTIGQHEFFELLEKHAHLFKRHSLPPLE